jgi:PST family polysaccharide transporter
MGLVKRSLQIALVIAPLVIAGYVLGLPHGPKGVALGYSLSMGLWVIPHILWCIHGTIISFTDIVRVLSRPLLSGVVAAAFPFALQVMYGHALSPLHRLLIGSILFLSAYLGMLLYVMGQKSFYVDLVRGLVSRSTVAEKGLVPA